LTYSLMKKASSCPLARGNTRNYLQKGKGMVTNRRLFLITVIVFFIFTTAGAVAETVKIGGKDAKLDLPANAKASLVLVPGNAGLSDRDPLQRAKMKYVGKGFAVLSIDKKTNIRAAMKYASEASKPVFIAAVSSGVSRLAGAIASPWFRAKKVVLVSGDLDSVRDKVGSSDMLPPTLVIHHRLDRCSNTSPTQVDKFQQWGGSKVTVHWMNGGSNSGDSCGAQSYHGLADLDDEVVNTITSFLEK
jgi:hypothetical protein